MDQNNVMRLSEFDKYVGVLKWETRHLGCQQPVRNPNIHLRVDLHSKMAHKIWFENMPCNEPI